MRRFIIVCVLLPLSVVTMQVVAQDNVQQDFIVEASVNNTSPYLGEQILYVFRLLSYVPQESFETLPTFEGFWLVDIYSPTAGQVEVRDGRQYLITELYVELLPLRDGNITIEPTTIDIEETVFRPAMTLSTDPITISVQPLPQGAPDTFNGAVGQFNSAFSVDLETITLGQPITLQMTVDGSGSLEQLPAPTLPDVEGWRVYSNPGRYVINTIGGLRFGQKIFEWLLIPENTGTQIFPSIEFTFFDPQVNEFKTQTSPEFVVEVFPGADNRTSLASFDEAGATVFDIPPLKQISSIRTGSSSTSTFSGIALWINPPLVFAVIVITVISNKVRRRRALEYRKQTALHRAVAQLEKTSGLSGRDASITGTKAIYRYFADKLSLKPDADALTIRNELENAQIQSTQRLNMLLSSVADLEGIQYSPQTIDVNASPIINTLIRQLHYVEQSWA